MKTTVVILAAGLGTRMRSKQAKVLHRAGGLSLVEHVVQAASAVTARDRIVVVTGHQADLVESLLQPMGVAPDAHIRQCGRCPAKDRWAEQNAGQGGEQTAGDHAEPGRDVEGVEIGLSRLTGGVSQGFVVLCEEIVVHVNPP